MHLPPPTIHRNFQDILTRTRIVFSNSLSVEQISADSIYFLIFVSSIELFFLPTGPSDTRNMMLKLLLFYWSTQTVLAGQKALERETVLAGRKFLARAQENGGQEGVKTFVGDVRCACPGTPV